MHVFRYQIHNQTNITKFKNIKVILALPWPATFFARRLFLAKWVPPFLEHLHELSRIKLLVLLHAFVYEHMWQDVYEM